MMLVNGEAKNLIQHTSSDEDASPDAHSMTVAHKDDADDDEFFQISIVTEAMEIIESGKAISQDVGLLKDKFKELVNDFDKLETQTNHLNTRLDLLKLKLTGKTTSHSIPVPQITHTTQVVNRTIVNTHITNSSSPNLTSKSNFHITSNDDQCVQEATSTFEDFSRVQRTAAIDRTEKTATFADDTNYDMHLELSETTMFQDASMYI
jgi:hypothetical protein